MNVSWLKALDQLGSPIASRAGRLLAHLGGAEISRRHLILRPGGMGDLICLQIALEELNLSPRDFDFCIERRSEPWARHQELRYFCYDRLADVTTLTSRRYSTVVNTEQLFGLSQGLARWVTAPSGHLTAFATNRAAASAHTRVPYEAFDSHETLEFQKLLRQALSPLLGPDHAPSLPRTPRRRERKMPATRGAVVAIAGRQQESRDFSLDSWADAIHRWLPSGPFTLIASPVDREFAHALAKIQGERATVFEGSFSESCRLIESAQCLLSVDGGSVHIASYYGVPTHAIFTSGREKKWAPLAQGSRLIFTPELKCRPCTLFGQTPTCPNGFACKKLAEMREITPCD